MQTPISRRTRLRLLLGFLVLSLTSLRSIPFMPFGADFQNIVKYEECAAHVSPYLISGAQCGDPWNRSFLYPPFLFRMFHWTRWFSPETAISIWAPLQFVLFAAVLAFWIKLERPEPESRVEVALFSGLLLFEYPHAFLLERGGSDVWAILFATLAARLSLRRRWLAAGAAFGVAAAYKLYPGVAGAVLFVALFCATRDRRPKLSATWVRFGLGLALGFFGVALLLFSESKVYFLHVIPSLSPSLSPLCEYSHSLLAATGDYPNLGRALFLGLAAIWTYAAGRAFARGDALAAVAGALAISTYLQGTSWDYNLVTTYPLLLILFLRGQASGRWGVLTLGLVSLVGERALFVTLGKFELFHLALQVWFLILAALEVARMDAPVPTETGALAE